jgi:glutaredoxin 3
MNNPASTPAPVVIYTSGFCPYCAWARQMLSDKGVDYREVRVDRDPGQRAVVESLRGRTSVPQIFVGDVHVGGYDDMAAMDREGRLDPLLGLSPS